MKDCLRHADRRACCTIVQVNRSLRKVLAFTCNNDKLYVEQLTPPYTDRLTFSLSILVLSVSTSNAMWSRPEIDPHSTTTIANTAPTYIGGAVGFLELPPELRNRIFEHVLIVAPPQEPRQPALIRICHQVRSERLSLYYATNSSELEHFCYDCDSATSQSISSHSSLPSSSANISVSACPLSISSICRCSLSSLSLRPYH